MSAVKIDPMKLPGPWADGYVLEQQHTVSSDVFDYQQRLKLLEGAFQVERDAVSGKRILLIDDLYRSGATAAVVAQTLLAGGAAAVFMLAITKTRTRT